MNLPQFHREAESELYAQADDYDARSHALGTDFLHEVFRIAADAEANPQHGTPFGTHTLRRPLRRFPHWLVYLPHEDGITVVAVMHPRREPGYWVHRLG